MLTLSYQTVENFRIFSDIDTDHRLVTIIIIRLFYFVRDQMLLWLLTVKEL